MKRKKKGQIIALVLAGGFILTSIAGVVSAVRSYSEREKQIQILEEQIKKEEIKKESEDKKEDSTQKEEKKENTEEKTSANKDEDSNKDKK